MPCDHFKFSKFTAESDPHNWFSIRWRIQFISVAGAVVSVTVAWPTVPLTHFLRQTFAVHCFFVSNSPSAAEEVVLCLVFGFALLFCLFLFRLFLTFFFLVFGRGDHRGFLVFRSKCQRKTTRASRSAGAVTKYLDDVALWLIWWSLGEMKAMDSNGCFSFWSKNTRANPKRTFGDDKENDLERDNGNSATQ